MRRKFLSVVLCVCMMLTMAPFAFAAEGQPSSGGGSGSSTSNTVTNAQELTNAINTATDNTTITVSGTIEISAPIDIDDTITITGTNNAEIKASSDFSGGYLIGFIFLALISGLFVDKFPKNRILAVAGMVIGMAVTYIFGTEWLAIQLKMSFVAALSVGVIPYLAGDAVKIIIAIIVGPVLRSRLSQLQ